VLPGTSAFPGYWMGTFRPSATSGACAWENVMAPSWAVAVAFLLQHQLVFIYYSPRLQAAVLRVWSSPFVMSFIKLFLFFVTTVTFIQAAFIRVELLHALAVRLPHLLALPMFAAARFVGAVQTAIARSVLLSTLAWTAWAVYLAAASVLVYIYWRTHYRIDTLQNNTYQPRSTILPSFGCLMCSMGMCLDNH